MYFGNFIRLGPLFLFLWLWMSLGDSGPFLFDNSILNEVTSSLDWDWDRASFAASIYEWALLALILFGLFHFFASCCNGISIQVSTQQMMTLVLALAIATLLLSVEQRSHAGQRAIGEEFARQGGCILFTHHSTIFTGCWYERIGLTISVLCSVIGTVFWLFRATGIKRI